MAAVLLAIVIAPLPLPFANAARGLLFAHLAAPLDSRSSLAVQGTAGSAF
jgi:hypothetical protein